MAWNYFLKIFYLYITIINRLLLYPSLILPPDAYLVSVQCFSASNYLENGAEHFEGYTYPIYL